MYVSVTFVGRRVIVFRFIFFIELRLCWFHHCYYYLSSQQWFSFSLVKHKRFFRDTKRISVLKRDREREGEGGPAFGRNQTVSKEKESVKLCREEALSPRRWSYDLIFREFSYILFILLLFVKFGGFLNTDVRWVGSC